MKARAKDRRALFKARKKKRLPRNTAVRSTLPYIEDFDGYTLDVGSGTDPKGDVNVDLYLDKSPHILPFELIAIKKPINGCFVCADGTMLPFKDNSFDMVNASQVMEHILEPVKLVREMSRVSRKWVTIEVPNLKKIALEANPHHLYSWSPETLKNFLCQFFTEVRIVGFPLNQVLPSNITRFIQGFAIKIFGPTFLRAVCRK